MKSKATFILLLVIIIVVAIVGYGLKKSFETAALTGSASATEPTEASEPTSASSASLGSDSDSPIDSVSGDLILVKAPGGTISAFSALTPDEQAKGLGGLASMPADQGMLFIFPSSGDYPFWMEGMEFPLDIIWISEDKKVVGLISNISPATYPDVFPPPSPIMYVLELNAGAAAKYSIATGTQLTF